MNVTAMIKRLRGKSYTVTRSNANGAYSTADGTFIPGATTTLTIEGSVQPMTSQDLVSIPEGDRTRERFRFYSFPDLLNIDNSTLRKGDVVSVSGVDFQVENIWHWPNHSKSIIVKVNTDAN